MNPIAEDFDGIAKALARIRAEETPACPECSGDGWVRIMGAHMPCPTCHNCGDVPEPHSDQIDYTVYG